MNEYDFFFKCIFIYMGQLENLLRRTIGPHKLQIMQMGQNGSAD